MHPVVGEPSLDLVDNKCTYKGKESIEIEHHSNHHQTTATSRTAHEADQLNDSNSLNTGISSVHHTKSLSPPNPTTKK